MKNRSLYTLLTLFFAGLVGLWWADRARVPTQADRDRARGRVLGSMIDARPDDVQKIEILDAPNQPVLVFERRPGNQWQMTSPLDVAADPSKVENLAFNLKELTSKPEAGTLSGDAAAFGLAPPSKIVRVWGKSTDAPLATLEVGKTSLSRRYVRVAGSEGIEVVDAQRMVLVDLPALGWRDRELFRVASFDVDSIAITRDDRVLKFQRSPDAWRVVEPFKSLADEAKIDAIVADLGSLRVTDDTRFVADNVKRDDLERYGLKTPGLTIELDAARSDPTRAPRTVHVGKPVDGKEGQVYVRRDDQDDVMSVDARVLKTMGLEPNAYRTSKVADLSPNRVVHIRVKNEGHEFNMGRKGNDWEILGPNPVKADRQAVQNFIKALDGLKTETYLTSEKVPDSGLEKPVYVLKVWQLPDPKLGQPMALKEEADFTLNVGRRDAGRKVYFGQTAGDKTILGLPETVGDILPKSSLAFRDRTVLNVASNQVEKLVFTGPKRRVVLNPTDLRVDAATKAPVGWWMAEPSPGLADSEAVARLLKLLSSLRADIFVIDTSDDLARYGLKTPALTLTWSTPSPFDPTAPTPDPNAGPGTRRLQDRSLLIGDEVPARPGSRFAKLEKDPLIFTLTAEALSLIDAEWRDRHVLTFEPARVAKIQFAWPDLEFNLVSSPLRNNGEWSLGGPINLVDFDSRKAAPMVRAASALMAIRYLQYEGDFPVEAGLSTPRVKIRFDFNEAGPSKSLRIGGKAGNGIAFATTTEGTRGPVFLIPEAAFANWLKAPRRPGDLPDNVFAPE